MGPFFELLQISLGNREALSKKLSSQEWLYLYKESEKQAILGIIICGIERLPIDQRPCAKLFLQWIGIGETIKEQNLLVYGRCVEVANIFLQDGYRYCILKGQANALMYPNRFSRTPGDIDVWIEGRKRKVVEYVHHLVSNSNEEYHHMQLPLFDDVEVEVHYYPSFCYNKINNIRLQNFFRESCEEQFCNYVKWENTRERICVPTVAFNLVFQLSHMMRHFFTQGIGIRHAIDYYYLLCQDIKNEEKEKALKIIKECGMYKFLCAIMWIEIVSLGLKKNADLAPSDEKVGKIVLYEMMKGGNFGKSYKHNQGGVIERYVREMAYRLRFIKEFPSEPLWRPFTLVWDFVKKKSLVLVSHCKSSILLV